MLTENYSNLIWEKKEQSVIHVKNCKKSICDKLKKTLCTQSCHNPLRRLQCCMTFVL